MNEHDARAGAPGASSLEIERKYEVSEAATLPPPAQITDVGLTAQPAETALLAASYFDTSERALAAQGLSVRRREGGHDAGWHLKERGADGTQETLWVLTDEPPAELLDTIRGRIGSAADALQPMASLRTRRVIVRLTDGAGLDAIELVDDHVHATDHVSGVVRVWREWEAELASGASALHLERLEPLLRERGAVPSLSIAKIARAGGMLTELALSSGANAEVLAAVSVTDTADRLAGMSDAGNADARVIELRLLANRITRGL